MNDNDYESAEEDIARALRLFERLDPESPTVVRCLHTWVDLRIRRGCGSITETTALLTRAVTLARSLHDDGLEQQLLNQKRRILFGAPRFEWRW